MACAGDPSNDPARLPRHDHHNCVRAHLTVWPPQPVGLRTTHYPARPNLGKRRGRTARLPHRGPATTQGARSPSHRLLSRGIADFRHDQAVQRLMIASTSSNLRPVVDMLMLGISLDDISVPPAAAEYARRFAQHDLSLEALLRLPAGRTHAPEVGHPGPQPAGHAR